MNKLKVYTKAILNTQARATNGGEMSLETLIRTHHRADKPWQDVLIELTEYAMSEIVEECAIIGAKECCGKCGSESKNCWVARKIRENFK